MLVTSAQAALSIVNVNHTYLPGTGIVQIPIQITGSDGVANFNAPVEIAAPGFVAAQGNFPGNDPNDSDPVNNPATPTITFLGNTNAYGDAAGDFTGNFMATTAHSTDFPTGNDDHYNFADGENVNQATPANIPASTNGGQLLTLVIDFTGFSFGTWNIIMDATNGNGPITFGNIAGQPVPVDLSQANFQVSIVPEPTSVVLGLFAVAGLGVVAIRKRRGRRSA